MPSSQHSYIPQVMNLILNSPHQSILDVGPGFGKYGVLCREYCDLIPAWFDKGLDGFDKKNWQVTIDAVEPCEKYITPLHHYIYNIIYNYKIESMLKVLNDYDLILMIGTLEHLEKPIGISVLTELQKKAKAIIVVTPNGFKPQKAEWGNPLEKHRCGWELREFKALDFECGILPLSNKIIAY